MLIPKELSELPIYAVGGCVRDHLLGIEPKDVDLSSELTIDEIIDYCNSKGIKTVVTGEQYGTVTILLDKSYEHTTFRKDLNCDGRHCDVEYVNDLVTDLSRRDFTINAMAMTYSGRVIDPFGGRKDLSLGVLRCVGNSVNRFTEDLLRIIRLYRFKSKFDYIIAEETEEAAIELLPILNNNIFNTISIERVVQEFNKVFENNEYNCGSFLTSMWFICVIKTIIPEMVGFDELIQHPVYHPEGTVLDHVIIVTELADAIHKWHALLHDIGKGKTAQLNGCGYYSFHNHENVGAALIPTILKRLRFSNDLIDSILITTKFHMHPYYAQRTYGETPPTKAIRKFQAACGDYLEDVRQVCLADSSNRIRPWIMFDKLDEPVIPVLMGKHLIEAGYQPGPVFGQVLKRAHDYQLETGCSDIDQLILEGVRI